MREKRERGFSLIPTFETTELQEKGLQRQPTPRSDRIPQHGTKTSGFWNLNT
uniref:Uncharacterized protein n=1 Tax=Anguilla anguilla TaxID=7936 RepID=A0A0E9TM26_ANGAN